VEAVGGRQGMVWWWRLCGCEDCGEAIKTVARQQRSGSESARGGSLASRRGTIMMAFCEQKQGLGKPPGEELNSTTP
jgi:hypothetical protein